MRKSFPQKWSCESPALLICSTDSIGEGHFPQASIIDSVAKTKDRVQRLVLDQRLSIIHSTGHIGKS